MSTDYRCPSCLLSLTLMKELGALVLRCYACRAHAIERDSRMQQEHKDRISAQNESKLE